MSDFYKKYLKYKKKYLDIKKGGNIIRINLDKYKELFKNALDLNFEVGFNLFYSNNEMNFEISKGFYNEIFMPYKQVIAIHTHHNHLYPTWEYKPPSQYDYVQACIDYFKYDPINIIIEKAGMWIYQPTNELIQEILNLEPNIKDLVKDSINNEGQQDKISIFLSNDLSDLLDVISNNSNFNNIKLNMTSENLKDVIAHLLFQEDYKNMTNEDLIKRMDEIKKLYQKIDLDEYKLILNNISDPDNNDKIGFDIQFIPWEQPFEFVFNLTPEKQQIFTEINNRKLNIFNENDIINDIANDTPSSYLLKKNK